MKLKKIIYLWTRPLMAAFAVAAIISAGCTRRVYVPVESVRTDSVRCVAERHDSITIRDSIYVAQRGDTVIREVYRWRERLSHHHDTVRTVCRDTIRIPVTEAIEHTDAQRTTSRTFRLATKTVITILVALGIALFMGGVYIRRMVR